MELEARMRVTCQSIVPAAGVPGPVDAGAAEAVADGGRSFFGNELIRVG